MVGKMAVTHFFVTTISGSSNKPTSSAAAAAIWLEPDAVGLFLLVWGFCFAKPDENNVSTT